MTKKASSKKESKPAKKGSQQKFMEYSMLRNQVEAISQELGMVVNTINTLGVAKDTLEYLGKTDEDEVMVPLGGNIFIKTKRKDTTKVLTGIGADLIIEKDIPSALEKLNEQMGELDEGRQKLEAQMKEIEEKLTKLEPEVQKLSAEMKKHQH